MDGKDLIFVFYGYSGDERKGSTVPNFATGVDQNRSFEIASTTLGVILKKLFPNSEIRVRRAWQKSKVFDSLKAADKTNQASAYHGPRGLDLAVSRLRI